mmetsp:Transcript_10746/g.43491  ORF Transcript_10746/g.43491 Transcript_10746/m.43491 type:complete len:258 (+) Transcript_10746:783-1556(+)
MRSSSSQSTYASAPIAARSSSIEAVCCPTMVAPTSPTGSSSSKTSSPIVVLSSASSSSAAVDRASARRLPAAWNSVTANTFERPDRGISPFPDVAERSRRGGASVCCCAASTLVSPSSSTAMCDDDEEMTMLAALSKGFRYESAPLARTAISCRSSTTSALGDMPRRCRSAASFFISMSTSEYASEMMAMTMLRMMKLASETKTMKKTGPQNCSAPRSATKSKSPSSERSSVNDEAESVRNSKRRSAKIMQWAWAKP